MNVSDGQTIAIWFSCGAASAVAAKKTVERYGNRCEIKILNNPIAEEDEDNFRFLKDIENWIGLSIETVASKKFPSNSAVDVWEKRQFMSGPMGAPCTLELKKYARQEWEKQNKVDWHVLGFTFEEKKRHDRFVLTERSNLLPILIEEKITKADCYAILQSNGIKLPRIYSMGYPNANCIGCVKATSATYWSHVRNIHPQIFDARAKQSRRIGAKLVKWKGRRLFLDELPLGARGKDMKNMDMECGLFCEEYVGKK